MSPTATTAAWLAEWERAAESTRIADVDAALAGVATRLAADKTQTAAKTPAAAPGGASQAGSTPSTNQHTGPFPPPTLNCLAEGDVVSCYEPYAGNVYCSGEGLLYCQSQRGTFRCEPNGKITEAKGVSLRCFP